MIAQLVPRNSIHSLCELVANAYDADAETVEIHYQPDRDLLTITDDGCGMSPKETDNFLRMGDSVKLRTQVTKGKARRCLGEFGVASIVIPSLGREYTLTTSKDGKETTIHEVFNGALKLEDEIEREIRTTEKERHGTFIAIKGLKLGSDFNLTKLKAAIQRQFRKLTTLPDFLVRVNDEEIKPSVIEKAVKFDASGKGERMGSVQGRIYFTSAGTEMRGVHITIDGRTYGEPSAMLDQLTEKHSIRSRTIVEIEADGLREAVRFDRSTLQEDHPGVQELWEHIRRKLAEVRQYAEEYAISRSEDKVRASRKTMLNTVRRRLLNASLTGITPATKIELTGDHDADNEFGGIYDESTDTIRLYDGGRLAIRTSTSRTEYLHDLMLAAVEIMTKRDLGEDKSLDEFLRVREELFNRIHNHESPKASVTRLYPSRQYTPAECANLTRHSLGAIRYMIREGFLPVQDEHVLGEDIIEAQEATEGMTTLYDVLNPQVVNMTTSLPVYQKMVQDHRELLAPFAAYFGPKHCIFIETICADSLYEVMTSVTHKSRINKAKALKQYKNELLTEQQIARRGNIPQAEVMKVVKYARRQGLELRTEGQKYHWGDFITALQERRFIG